MTDWNEHEDAIDDAISDSIDMDWTSRTGAKAVVAWLNENAAAPAPSSLAGGEVWAALEPFAKVADTALCPSDEPDDNDFIRLDETIAITVADIRRAASVFAALSPEAPAREGESKGVGIGLCIAAGIAVASGAEGAAREILGAAGLTTEAAMRDAGVDAYDISLLADIIKEMAEKANG